ncbi:hypothetical protein PS712_05444 [Pseudomonas fluorescens]|uniref:Uncharacterized protein n=1 Tax=Pseudomonas fluorescens TaxID=294 RepID=A0A5E7FBZ0_PSEFL|nr:hypothetical protein PS712_05444 [Pseudomonas fluorescens]
MPQSSQIIGANSVTNIELDKGVLPAPIVRNADWLESCLVRIADRRLCPSVASKTLEGVAYEFDHCSLPL